MIKSDDTRVKVFARNAYEKNNCSVYAYGVNCKSDSMHISRNNDRAVIPGSSITPAPGAAKEIKGDGENPTLTGVLTLRDADTAECGL